MTDTCRWCDRDAARRSGRSRLCVQHYRFQQMRVSAKRNGKSVPSYHELETLLAECRMVCPACRRPMVWLQSQDRSLVITLQHDRSGAHRLLCFSCNSRHGKDHGDDFYEVGPGNKRCSVCRKVKTLREFFAQDGCFGGVRCVRKECRRKAEREWARTHRDQYNARARRYHSQSSESINARRRQRKAALPVGRAAEAMRASALARQCPACGRRAALRRPTIEGRRCRFCGHLACEAYIGRRSG